ncbi:hypothetical protein D3C73_1139570 [compost metagenome]
MLHQVLRRFRHPVLAKVARSGTQHHWPFGQWVSNHIGIGQLTIDPQCNVDPLFDRVDDSIVRQHPQSQFGMCLQQRCQRLCERTATDANGRSDTQLPHQSVTQLGQPLFSLLRLKQHCLAAGVKCRPCLGQRQPSCRTM